MPSEHQSEHAPAGVGNSVRVWRWWALLFGLTLVLFACTANRGAQWQDSGYHIQRIMTGEATNPLGLALSHPLHHWLGRAAVVVLPVEPCFAITLISSLAAALAVANTFGCVWTLTRSRSAALFAAGSLALANTFWQLATLSETYTLGAALFAAECWCLAAFATQRRPRFLYLMALFNGLGVSTHMLAILTTPIVGLVAVWCGRAPTQHGKAAVVRLSTVIAVWLLGSLFYSVMIGMELARTGDALGTLASAFFGHAYSQHVLGVHVPLRQIGVTGAFVLLNFPSLLLPLSGYGMAVGTKIGIPTMARRAFLAAAALHACFALRYCVIDQHMFLLPFYTVMCVFGGIGFAAISNGLTPARSRCVRKAAIALLFLSPVVYGFVPLVASRFGLLEGVGRNRPYRDDYEYLFWPWSVVERSAQRMSVQAIQLARPDGLIIVEDRGGKFAVQYQAIREGAEDAVDIVEYANSPRNNLGIIPQAVADGRRIVLVPTNRDKPSTPAETGNWKRIGDLYVLDYGQPAARDQD